MMPVHEFATIAEHRQRHIDLHRALDELLADFIDHRPAGESLLNTTVLTLITWATMEAEQPTEPRR